MKLYKRSDFIVLPAGTIYSRVRKDYGELLHGLFCKTTGPEYTIDWVEQNILGEPKAPDELTDGGEIWDYILNRRDTFQEFETDLDCAGRDGMFNDEDVFVVWNKKDVTKLIDYLTKAIE